jgi:hypothetical protein
MKRSLVGWAMAFTTVERSTAFDFFKEAALRIVGKYAK